MTATAIDGERPPILDAILASQRRARRWFRIQFISVWIFLVGLLDDPPTRLIRRGIPEGGGAVVRLAIVAAVTLLVANGRMRHMHLSGASD